MPEPPSDVGLRVPALDELQPEDRAEASEARRYIRANFDAMTAARDRGVSWQQITDTLAAAGVVGANAAPLGWRQLKSLYHTERYARGGKRQRQKARLKAKAVAPVSMARPEVTGTPPASAEPKPSQPPAPAGIPASPYAEMDRQMAEKRRVREEIERAKNWNPYPAPRKKDEPDE